MSCEVCRSIGQPCAACFLEQRLLEMGSAIRKLAKSDVATPLRALVASAWADNSGVSNRHEVDAFANLYWSAEPKVITAVRDLKIYGEQMVEAGKEFLEFGDIGELLYASRNLEPVCQSVGICVSEFEGLEGKCESIAKSFHSKRDHVVVTMPPPISNNEGNGWDEIDNQRRSFWGTMQTTYRYDFHLLIAINFRFLR